jgi:hypothetical protein
MSGGSRILWLLAGGARAAASSILLANPSYWDPATTLDWAAVWLFTAALLLLGPSVLALARLTPSRSTMAAAVVIAIGAIAAGVANALEDGLGVKAMGTLYVIGFLTAGLSLPALAAAFRHAGASRLAGLSLALFLGVLLFTIGGGLIILFALGAIAVSPSWFLRRATPPSSALGGLSRSV